MRSWILAGMLLSVSTAWGDDVVLYDAAATPIKAVSSQSGAKIALRNGLLEVETKGETGFPGVRVRGRWDLSKCNRLVLELATRDPKGAIPLTVRIDNPDSDAAHSKGVFVDRIKVPAGGVKSVVVNLPPVLPYGRQISDKLFGMKRSPLATTGVVAALDPKQVVGVAVYLATPRLDWRWGVKRIVAQTGPTPEVPAWMRLKPEQFFPFIDVYGQFKHKDWPGKTHSDADLKRAREAEAADLAAHPGPSGWNKYFD